MKNQGIIKVNASEIILIFEKKTNEKQKIMCELKFL